MLAERLKLQRRIDHRIVRLRSAAGENNFRRFTPKQPRQPIASQIDGLSRLGSKAIPSRRIAVILPKKLHHFLDYGRIELRGGIVVEVNEFVVRHQPPL
jgi:hypothetical protein